MLKLYTLGLAALIATGLGAGAAHAGTDRIITGSGATPPAFVEVGPQQFERYDIATAPSGNSIGGTDGVMTGAEHSLKPLANAGDSIQRIVDSIYPGENGYRSVGRVDP